MKMECDRNGLAVCLLLTGTVAKMFGVMED